MHVDDLAEACIFALENWYPNNNNSPIDESGEPLTWLNVGTGIDVSIKELAEMIAKVTSYDGDIVWDLDKPDGTFQKLLDISNLTNLGWNSKISLEKGLKKTYAEYKNDFRENNLRNK